MITLVVLYGCKTCFVTLREEHRLKNFENRVLRRMFGPEWDEITGQLRKLHSPELYNLYSSPDIIRRIKSRRMRWAGHVARMGEWRNVCRVLVGRLEGKSPLERPWRRWENWIRMVLRKTLGGAGGVQCIYLARNGELWRDVVNTVTKRRVLASLREEDFRM
jgi:hypothetical protein